MTHLEDELGDIVSKARLGWGCPVEKLAAATGISKRDIERIESYEYKPDGGMLDRVADALSLNPVKLKEIALDVWQPAPPRVAKDKIILDGIEVPHGNYSSNCYIVGCPDTRIAAVVDPGGAADTILRKLSEYNLELDFVLITHAHGDHVGGLKRLLENAHNVLLVNSMVERDSATRGVTVKWQAAQDGVRIPMGSLSVTSLSTPGHTPGSMCYLIDGVCFVGDTLFAGSIGRPSSHTVYQQMLSQIQLKILSLPDDTILLPGHGPATTVAEEKAHNPFFA